MSDGPKAAQVDAIVAKLPLVHQLAFAASVCERLLVNYTRFQEQTHWGDFMPLRAGVERLWSLASGNVADPRETRELIRRIEKITPQPGDFASLYASAALDAAAATVSGLRYEGEGTLQLLLDVGVLARDSVDMWIQVRDEMLPHAPTFEERIATHPLMARELKRQYKEASWLMGHESLRPKDVEHFRAVVRSDEPML